MRFRKGMLRIVEGILLLRDRDANFYQALWFLIVRASLLILPIQKVASIRPLQRPRLAGIHLQSVPSLPEQLGVVIWRAFGRGFRLFIAEGRFVASLLARNEILLESHFGKVLSYDKSKVRKERSFLRPEKNPRFSILLVVSATPSRHVRFWSSGTFAVT